jgi:release factor glutamine methyltransferase
MERQLNYHSINIDRMTTPLLSDVTTRLSPTSDTPALDASVLIAHILHKPRTWVMAHPELTLTTEQQEQLSPLLARLEAGEAFPYVLGHWEFFGMDFDITPDVLIPRPETELLVEKAVGWLQESSARSPLTALRVADVGTGSGVIAVSIATYVPAVKVLATDISHKALKVARKNAIKFDVVHRIDFVQCDLLPNHPGSIPTQHHFDLICANLPYIPTETLRNLPIYGREPALALDGGTDGLTHIRRLLQAAPEWLAPTGMLLLEIEATQGEQVVNLARSLFTEATIQLHQDLAGQDRLLQIVL